MADTRPGELLTDLHRRRQVAIATAADSEIRRAMDVIDLSNIDASRAAWNDRMVGVVAKYHKVSQIQATTYLSHYWDAERPGGAADIVAPRFEVVVTQGVLDAAGPQALKKSIGKGAPPLSALQQVSHSIQDETRKMILAGGRGVVRASGLADRRAIGVRRVSDGDPCSFCAMLVSRGPAYMSEASALAKGNGDPYHKRCGCSVEIIYSDWVPTPEEQQYVDSYYRAAEEATAAGEPRTAETVLYRMRAGGTFGDSPARRTASA